MPPPPPGGQGLIYRCSGFLKILKKKLDFITIFTQTKFFEFLGVKISKFLKIEIAML